MFEKTLPPPPKRTPQLTFLFKQNAITKYCDSR